MPGLQILLDQAQDEPGAGEPSLADIGVTLGAGTPPGDRTPLAERVRRVAIAIAIAIAININMDVDTGLNCDSLTHAALHIDCVTGAAFQPSANPDIRAMVVAELYRHTVDGLPAWKLRALRQGWADGLDGLARAYGVDVG
ncbi:TerD family protein [Streptomyces sp. NPDC014983]|uniref:TerD family protein n=1 Tax=Streptomyces sp. NPDC014983 TaxID=3364933 RepID=UPI003701A19E